MKTKELYKKITTNYNLVTAIRIRNFELGQLRSELSEALYLLDLAKTKISELESECNELKRRNEEQKKVYKNLLSDDENFKKYSNTKEDNRKLRKKNFELANKICDLSAQLLKHKP